MRNGGEACFESFLPAESFRLDDRAALHELIRRFLQEYETSATRHVALLNDTKFLGATQRELIVHRQRDVVAAFTRFIKRGGKIWIRIFPDVPVSKKPTEVRMGKGKGAPELWAVRVAPGRIMFEIDGVSEETAREALRLAAAKLPVRTRFIQRIAD